MACDMCGKVTTELTELLDSYKTSEVKMVCNGCEKAITKEIFRLRAIVAKDTIKFIEAQRAKRRAGLFGTMMDAMIFVMSKGKHDAP